MTETFVYRDQTEKGLFKLWLEAREAGCESLTEEIMKNGNHKNAR